MIVSYDCTASENCPSFTNALPMFLKILNLICLPVFGICPAPCGTS